jgi:hypothetical protein
MLESNNAHIDRLLNTTSTIVALLLYATIIHHGFSLLVEPDELDLLDDVELLE